MCSFAGVYAYFVVAAGERRRELERVAEKSRLEKKAR